jgi:hypothetical protein
VWKWYYRNSIPLDWFITILSLLGLEPEPRWGKHCKGIGECRQLLSAKPDSIGTTFDVFG